MGGLDGNPSLGRTRIIAPLWKRTSSSALVPVVTDGKPVRWTMHFDPVSVDPMIDSLTTEGADVTPPISNPDSPGHVPPDYGPYEIFLVPGSLAKLKMDATNYRSTWRMRWRPLLPGYSYNSSAPLNETYLADTTANYTFWQSGSPLYRQGPEQSLRELLNHEVLLEVRSQNEQYFATYVIYILPLELSTTAVTWNLAAGQTVFTDHVKHRVTVNGTAKYFRMWSFDPTINNAVNDPRFWTQIEDRVSSSPLFRPTYRYPGSESKLYEFLVNSTAGHFGDRKLIVEFLTTNSRYLSPTVAIKGVQSVSCSPSGTDVPMRVAKNRRARLHMKAYAGSAPLSSEDLTLSLLAGNEAKVALPLIEPDTTTSPKETRASFLASAVETEELVLWVTLSESAHPYVPGHERFAVGTCSFIVIDATHSCIGNRHRPGYGSTLCTIAQVEGSPTLTLADFGTPLSNPNLGAFSPMIPVDGAPLPTWTLEFNGTTGGTASVGAMWAAGRWHIRDSPGGRVGSHTVDVITVESFVCQNRIPVQLRSRCRLQSLVNVFPSDFAIALPFSLAVDSSDPKVLGFEWQSESLNSTGFDVPVWWNAPWGSDEAGFARVIVFGIANFTCAPNRTAAIPLELPRFHVVNCVAMYLADGEGIVPPPAVDDFVMSYTAPSNSISIVGSASDPLNQTLFISLRGLLPAAPAAVRFDYAPSRGVPSQTLAKYLEVDVVKAEIKCPRTAKFFGTFYCTLVVSDGSAALRPGDIRLMPVAVPAAAGTLTNISPRLNFTYTSTVPVPQVDITAEYDTGFVATSANESIALGKNSTVLFINATLECDRYRINWNGGKASCRLNKTDESAFFPAVDVFTLELAGDIAILSPPELIEDGAAIVFTITGTGAGSGIATLNVSYTDPGGLVMEATRFVLFNTSLACDNLRLVIGPTDIGKVWTNCTIAPWTAPGVTSILLEDIADITATNGVVESLRAIGNNCTFSVAPSFKQAGLTVSVAFASGGSTTSLRAPIPVVEFAPSVDCSPARASAGTRVTCRLFIADSSPGALETDIEVRDLMGSIPESAFAVNTSGGNLVIAFDAALPGSNLTIRSSAAARALDMPVGFQIAQAETVAIDVENLTCNCIAMLPDGSGNLVADYSRCRTRFFSGEGRDLKCYANKHARSPNITMSDFIVSLQSPNDKYSLDYASVTAPAEVYPNIDPAVNRLRFFVRLNRNYNNASISVRWSSAVSGGRSHHVPASPLYVDVIALTVACPRGDTVAATYAYNYMQVRWPVRSLLQCNVSRFGGGTLYASDFSGNLTLKGFGNGVDMSAELMFNHGALLSQLGMPDSPGPFQISITALDYAFTCGTTGIQNNKTVTCILTNPSGVDINDVLGGVNGVPTIEGAYLEAVPRLAYATSLGMTYPFGNEPAANFYPETRKQCDFIPGCTCDFPDCDDPSICLSCEPVKTNQKAFITLLAKEPGYSNVSVYYSADPTNPIGSSSFGIFEAQLNCSRTRVAAGDKMNCTIVALGAVPLQDSFFGSIAGGFSQASITTTLASTGGQLGVRVAKAETRYKTNLRNAVQLELGGSGSGPRDYLDSVSGVDTIIVGGVSCTPARLWGGAPYNTTCRVARADTTSVLSSEMLLDDVQWHRKPIYVTQTFPDDCNIVVDVVVAQASCAFRSTDIRNREFETGFPSYDDMVERARTHPTQCWKNTTGDFEYYFCNNTDWGMIKFQNGTILNPIGPDAEYYDCYCKGWIDVQEEVEWSNELGRYNITITRTKTSVCFTYDLYEHYNPRQVCTPVPPFTYLAGYEALPEPLYSDSLRSVEGSIDFDFASWILAPSTCAKYGFVPPSQADPFRPSGFLVRLDWTEFASAAYDDLNKATPLKAMAAQICIPVVSAPVATQPTEHDAKARGAPGCTAYREMVVGHEERCEILYEKYGDIGPTLRPEDFKSFLTPTNGRESIQLALEQNRETGTVFVVLNAEKPMSSGSIVDVRVGFPNATKEPIGIAREIFGGTIGAVFEYTLHCPQTRIRAGRQMTCTFEQAENSSDYLSSGLTYSGYNAFEVRLLVPKPNVAGDANATEYTPSALFVPGYGVPDALDPPMEEQFIAYGEYIMQYKASIQRRASIGKPERSAPRQSGPKAQLAVPVFKATNDTVWCFPFIVAPKDGDLPPLSGCSISATNGSAPLESGDFRLATSRPDVEAAFTTSAAYTIWLSVKYTGKQNNATGNASVSIYYSDLHGGDHIATRDFFFMSARVEILPEYAYKYTPYRWPAGTTITLRVVAENTSAPLDPSYISQETNYINQAAGDSPIDRIKPWTLQTETVTSRTGWVYEASVLTTNFTVWIGSEGVWAGYYFLPSWSRSYLLDYENAGEEISQWTASVSWYESQTTFNVIYVTGVSCNRTRLGLGGTFHCVLGKLDDFNINRNAPVLNDFNITASPAAGFGVPSLRSFGDKVDSNTRKNGSVAFKPAVPFSGGEIAFRWTVGGGLLGTGSLEVTAATAACAVGDHPRTPKCRAAAGATVTIEVTPRNDSVGLQNGDVPWSTYFTTPNNNSLTALYGRWNGSATLLDVRANFASPRNEGRFPWGAPAMTDYVMWELAAATVQIQVLNGTWRIEIPRDASRIPVGANVTVTVRNNTGTPWAPGLEPEDVTLSTTIGTLSAPVKVGGSLRYTLSMPSTPVADGGSLTARWSSAVDTSTNLITADGPTSFKLISVTLACDTTRRVRSGTQKVLCTLTAQSGSAPPLYLEDMASPMIIGQPGSVTASAIRNSSIPETVKEFDVNGFSTHTQPVQVRVRYAFDNTIEVTGSPFSIPGGLSGILWCNQTTLGYQGVATCSVSPGIGSPNLLVSDFLVANSTKNALRVSSFSQMGANVSFTIEALHASATTSVNVYWADGLPGGNGTLAATLPVEIRSAVSIACTPLRNRILGNVTCLLSPGGYLTALQPSFFGGSSCSPTPGACSFGNMTLGENGTLSFTTTLLLGGTHAITPTFSVGLGGGAVATISVIAFQAAPTGLTCLPAGLRIAAGNSAKCTVAKQTGSANLKTGDILFSTSAGGSLGLVAEESGPGSLSMTNAASTENGVSFMWTSAEYADEFSGELIGNKTMHILSASTFSCPNATRRGIGATFTCTLSPTPGHTAFVQTDVNTPSCSAASFAVFSTSAAATGGALESIGTADVATTGSSITLSWASIVLHSPASASIGLTASVVIVDATLSCAKNRIRASLGTNCTLVKTSNSPAFLADDFISPTTSDSNSVIASWNLASNVFTFEYTTASAPNAPTDTITVPWNPNTIGGSAAAAPKFVINRIRARVRCSQARLRLYAGTLCFLEKDGQSVNLLASDFSPSSPAVDNAAVVLGPLTPGGSGSQAFIATTQLPTVGATITANYSDAMGGGDVAADRIANVIKCVALLPPSRRSLLHTILAIGGRKLQGISNQPLSCERSRMVEKTSVLCLLRKHPLSPDLLPEDFTDETNQPLKGNTTAEGNLLFVYTPARPNGPRFVYQVNFSADLGGGEAGSTSLTVIGAEFTCTGDRRSVLGVTQCKIAPKANSDLIELTDIEPPFASTGSGDVTFTALTAQSGGVRFNSIAQRAASSVILAVNWAASVAGAPSPLGAFGLGVVDARMDCGTRARAAWIVPCYVRGLDSSAGISSNDTFAVVYTLGEATYVSRNFTANNPKELYIALQMPPSPLPGSDGFAIINWYGPALGTYYPIPALNSNYSVVAGTISCGKQRWRQGSRVPCTVTGSAGSAELLLSDLVQPQAPALGPVSPIVMLTANGSENYVSFNLTVEKLVKEEKLSVQYTDALGGGEVDLSPLNFTVIQGTIACERTRLSPGAVSTCSVLTEAGSPPVMPDDLEAPTSSDPASVSTSELTVGLNDSVSFSYLAKKGVVDARVTVMWTEFMGGGELLATLVSVVEANLSCSPRVRQNATILCALRPFSVGASVPLALQLRVEDFDASLNISSIGSLVQELSPAVNGSMFFSFIPAATLVPFVNVTAFYNASIAPVQFSEVPGSPFVVSVVSADVACSKARVAINSTFVCSLVRRSGSADLLSSDFVGPRLAVSGGAVLDTNMVRSELLSESADGVSYSVRSLAPGANLTISWNYSEALGEGLADSINSTVQVVGVRLNCSSSGYRAANLSRILCTVQPLPAPGGVLVSPLTSDFVLSSSGLTVDLLETCSADRDPAECSFTLPFYIESSGPSAELELRYSQDVDLHMSHATDSPAHFSVISAHLSCDRNRTAINGTFVCAVHRNPLSAGLMLSDLKAIAFIHSSGEDIDSEISVNLTESSADQIAFAIQIGILGTARASMNFSAAIGAAGPSVMPAPLTVCTGSSAVCAFHFLAPVAAHADATLVAVKYAEVVDASRAHVSNSPISISLISVDAECERNRTALNGTIVCSLRRRANSADLLSGDFVVDIAWRYSLSVHNSEALVAPGPLHWMSSRRMFRVLLRIESEGSRAEVPVKYGQPLDSSLSHVQRSPVHVDVVAAEVSCSTLRAAVSAAFNCTVTPRAASALMVATDLLPPSSSDANVVAGAPEPPFIYTVRVPSAHPGVVLNWTYNEVIVCRVVPNPLSGSPNVLTDDISADNATTEPLLLGSLESCTANSTCGVTFTVQATRLQPEANITIRYAQAIDPDERPLSSSPVRMSLISATASCTRNRSAINAPIMCTMTKEDASADLVSGDFENALLSSTSPAGLQLRNVPINATTEPTLVSVSLRTSLLGAGMRIAWNYSAPLGGLPVPSDNTTVIDVVGASLSCATSRLFNGSRTTCWIHELPGSAPLEARDLEVSTSEPGRTHISPLAPCEANGTGSASCSFEFHVRLTSGTPMESVAIIVRYNRAIDPEASHIEQSPFNITTLFLANTVACPRQRLARFGNRMRPHKKETLSGFAWRRRPTPS
eukprot:tig00020704_g13166.t1